MTSYRCKECKKESRYPHHQKPNFCPFCGKSEITPIQELVSPHQLSEDNPVQQAARKGFSEVLPKREGKE